VKHKVIIGTSTRIVHKLPYSAFLVRENDLINLDQAICSSPIFTSLIDTRPKPTYLTFYTNGETCRFDSLQDLLKHPNTAPEIISGLEINIGATRYEQINVLLEPDGDITVDIAGPSHVVESAAHILRGRLAALNHQYSWIANSFVLNSRIRRITAKLVFLITLCLTFLIGYYIYAQFVGVNVDPQLIPHGMTYYQEVEKAINSSDISQKVNILLRGHYAHFTNLTDFSNKYRTLIGYLLTSFIILFAFTWISRHLVKYYPRAFFAIGSQIEHLRRIEKGREFWVIGLITAFFINVAAGMVIYLVGK
jgi:hypothetical protein